MEDQITVLVLNYNKFELTRKFFENNRYYINNVHWCLVDNGSDQCTINNLIDYAKSKNWNIWKPDSQDGWENIHIGNEKSLFDLVLLPQNFGYAKGNNYGVRFIEFRQTPDYILVVNNDVEWDENIIDPLVKVIERYDDVAVVAPRIIDKNGIEQNPQFLIESTKMLQTFFRLGYPLSVVFYRFYSQFYNFNSNNKAIYKNTQDPFFLDLKKYCFMGSCFLIKYQFFKNIGFFDPNTFLGAEEPILVSKLRERNYRVVIIPSVTVLHNQGETCRSVLSTEKIMEIFEDSDEYYLKNYCNYSPSRLRFIKLGRRYYINIWLPMVVKFRQLTEHCPK
jgi:GT2 family glycosyltransferase